MLKPYSFALLVLVTSSRCLSAADWITAPSYYSHDPQTAKPVSQYAAIGPYYYLHADVMRSGYRHIRSSIQVGGSADNFHIVEEFGNPVRPYDEWRFPYRPYSAPYPLWGNANAGAGFGVPFGGGFGPGFGGGGFGAGMNYPPVLVPPGHGYVPQQFMDGHYPAYNRHDRSEYYRPYGPPGP